MAKRKDPKVGTGKKPKGSGRRLYTDENPKDTVSFGFSSVYSLRPDPLGFLPIPTLGSFCFAITNYTF